MAVGIERASGRGGQGGIAGLVRTGALILAVALPLMPVAGGGAWAQAAATTVAPDVQAQAEALLSALRIDDTIGILREEGLAYGATLEADMFPGGGGSGWSGTVERIYDAPRMREAFAQALTAELAKDPAAIGGMVEFFSSDLGQRVVELEIEARRAFLDDATEEAAKVAWQELQADGGARLEALERFITVNDLVESNVSGALNANLAFYRGMDEGGAFGGEMTEDQMLSDVWAQEPEVRQSTTEWVYSYLNLAYGPLGDEDLAAYTAFSESEVGQKANRALFAAFDKVFTPISTALGVAVARQLQGQDI